MKTKTICLLLAALMLLLALSACGENTPSVTTNPDDTQITTESPATSTEYVEQLVLPDDHKYNGSTFTILCTANMANPPTPFKENSGYSEIINEAVYQRNAKIEDSFDVVIELIEEYSLAVGPTVTRFIANRTSGDTMYDSSLIAVQEASQLAYQGYLSDLGDMPYVCLEKSWWDQNANKEISIFGKTYYTTGDISFSDKEYTFSVVFNKDLAKEKNIEDLYALVREGKWTLDKLSELSQLVSEDLDGNDILDQNDQYGLMVWAQGLVTMIHGSGNSIARIDENDQFVLSLNNETCASVTTDFVKLLNEPSSVNFQSSKAIEGSWMTMVKNNQVLFLLQYLKAVPLLRDSEIPFGILPVPKYTESQDRYHCGITNLTAMYSVPADIADEEMSGVLSEAMASYSQKTVTPAYIERAVKGLYVSDEESVETLELIFANRLYDLGTFYRLGALNTMLGNIVMSKNDTFASDYGRYSIAAEKMANQINDFFQSSND
ncbi:MAG: hypothetical protein SPJ23_03130 [Eubacteriales bacterium]|nr:hypothetical protein [Eubacteriales bacterium]